VKPEEGLMIWSDNMIIPNLATHQGNAEKWIDYYYDPEVAAKLAAYVWYISPVDGAQQAMEKVGPDLVKAGLIDDVASMVDNQLIFPSEDYLKSTHSFMALDEATMRQYEGDFSDVITG
jgi:spermidine/putrescine transport system substrate-binding protein